MTNPEGELPKPDQYGQIPPREENGDPSVAPLEIGPITGGDAANIGTWQPCVDDREIQGLRDPQPDEVRNIAEQIKRDAETPAVPLTASDYANYIHKPFVDDEKLPDVAFWPEAFQEMREYHDIYLVGARAVMGQYVVIKDEKLEPPKPVLDPYPSRAGWRADYLPDFDPAAPIAEEKTDVNIGKIGEYDIISTATTFEDIGGNEEGKEVLIDIAEQFEDPESFTAWDVPIPKGVLLYGDAGTGKTMLAKAFANRAKAAFVEIPLATIRSAFYGETDKNLQNVFAKAKEYGKPVVLFFDEIDSMLGSRDQLDPSNPDSRLVNTFLQCVDGVTSSSNVMVLGATNYPNKLDKAATRPGRFDRKVHVLPPDQRGIKQIAARQLLKAERATKRVLVDDELNLDMLARALDGSNGSDIAEIVNRTKRVMARRAKELGKRISAATQGLNSAEASRLAGERDALRITTADLSEVASSYISGK